MVWLAPLAINLRIQYSIPWRADSLVFMLVNYHRILIYRLFLSAPPSSLHWRRKKSSTIFCSQYDFEKWYDQLGGDDSPLADALIDRRIAPDSYRINIKSIDAEHDISMREVCGLAKTLRE